MAAYDVREDGIVGQRATTMQHTTQSLINKAVKQVTEINFTAHVGNAAEHIRITNTKTGDIFDLVVDTTGAADEIAAANLFRDAITAHPFLRVELDSYPTTDNGGGLDADLDLTFSRPGVVYLVEVVFATTTIVVSETTAASNAQIPFGFGVAKVTGDDEAMALPSGAASADLVGFLLRTEGESFHDALDPTYNTVEGLEAGVVGTVLTSGDIRVKVQEASAKNGQVYVQVTAAGSFAVGSIRAVSDVNNVAATGWRFRNSTAGTGRNIIEKV